MSRSLLLLLIASPHDSFSSSNKTNKRNLFAGIHYNSSAGNLIPELCADYDNEACMSSPLGQPAE